MERVYSSVDEVVKIWKELAAKRGYILNEKISKKFGKPLYELAARAVVMTMGRCPCLPAKRPICPCEEMEEDIRKSGHCFCKVFFDPNWVGR